MKLKITLQKTFTLVFTLIVYFNLNAQWTPVNSGLPSTETVGLANVRDTLFTAVKNHGVYYSVNNGDNWTAWKHNDQLTSKNITKLEGLSTFPTTAGGNHLLIYGPSMLHYYVSVAGADGVTGGGYKLTNFMPPNQEIYAWSQEKDNGVETNFIGTNNGFYRKVDNGNWTQATGLSGNGLIVNGIHFQEYDDDSKAVFAFTNDGVYKSTDLGVSFSAFRNGINADVKVYENNIFVATNSGMYTYNNNDDKFNSFIATGDFRTSIVEYSTFIGYVFGDGIAKKVNLMNSAIEDISQTNITGGIIIDSSQIKDYLFICTESGGVFRILKSNTSLGLENNSLDHISFKTYPNPSNGSFTIETKKPVITELYNMNGRLVKSFKVNSTQKINLNLASGMYLIKERGKNGMKKIIIN